MITPKESSEITKIADFKLPAYEEIPNGGLFLDQVTKYVQDYLQVLEGISITSSMISNYVKKGLVDNSIKKKYYRDQIVYIFFIAVVKSVLSLEEIEILISFRAKEHDIALLYGYLKEEFKNALSFVFGIDEEMKEAQIEYNEERYLLRHTIITAAHKIYLDTIFKLNS